MMPFVMTRKAMIAWGGKPAPEVAAMVGDEKGDRHIVTWSEVMDNRRKRQAERLELIRRPSAQWHAYRVWVAYYDMTLMGGWQSYIESNTTKDYYGGWIDRDRRWVKPMLMKAFPLVLPLGSEADQWAMWKEAFAKQYQRGIHDRKPRGCAYVWWNERDQPIPVRNLCR